MIKNIDIEKCTGCGICADICPLDTIRIDPFQKELSPCQFVCPAGVDIRAYMNFLKLGMKKKAMEIISNDLPFPSITGRLCHHPCMSKCARNNIDESIKINDIEKYLGDSILKRKRHLEALPITHASTIAVIGSGPMGLSVSYFLRRLGYCVEVLEAENEFGGSLLSEVQKGRLSDNILKDQIEFMKSIGINFHKKYLFTDVNSLNELRNNGFRAIFLSPGFVGRDSLKFRKENLETDSVTFQTNIESLFLGGGIIFEKAPIAKIVLSGKKAAMSIDRYLQRRVMNSNFEDSKLTEKIPFKGIKGKKSSINGEKMSDDKLFEESFRCITCGSKAIISHPDDCMTCYYCELSCPSEAIFVHPYKEELPTSLNY